MNEPHPWRGPPRVQGFSDLIGASVWGNFSVAFSIKPPVNVVVLQFDTHGSLISDDDDVSTLPVLAVGRILAFLIPVGPSIKGEEGAVHGEPVQDGRGGHRVEHFPPLRGNEVRGHKGRRDLGPFGDDLSMPKR